MRQWQHHLVPTRRRKKEGTGKHLNKNPPHFQWAGYIYGCLILNDKFDIIILEK